MKHIYVFDTSVLAYDPESIYQFPNQQIIFQISTLEELDKLKSFPNEVGKNARIFIRNLNELSKSSNIVAGIKLKNKATLKVDSGDYGKEFSDPSYADNKILSCALALQKKNKTCKVILLSRDFCLIVRARAAGLEAEIYDHDKVKFEELFTGHRQVENTTLGNQLINSGFVECSKSKDLQSMVQNEYVLFTNKGDGISMGRKVGDTIKTIKNHNPWGVAAKNREQAMAIDMLMDEKLPLVTLIGKAGSGKTFLALAAALELVIERKKYEKMIIYRSTEPIENLSLGYLPGTLSEKLSVFEGPINDSLEQLFENKRKISMYDLYREKDIIQVDTLAHARGRSIANSLIIIDEAQNMSAHVIKLALTRINHGSKVIMTGDIEQIDNPKLDATSNGLTYVMEKLKNSELTGSITLNHSERSPLAALAANEL